MKEKKAIRFYARGNAGATEPSEELVSIAEEVKRIWEDKGLREVRKFLKNYEFENTGWDFEVKKQKIIITNEMLTYGPGGSVEASWGFERAEIYKDTSLSKINRAESNILKWAKGDEYEYEIVEFDAGEYAVYGALESLPFEVDFEDVIDKKSFTELINAFFEYLRNDFSETPPGEQARPVYGADPYVYDEPDWDYEIDGDYLTLKTSCPELLGSCYHTVSEYLTIKRSKSISPDREAGRQKEEEVETWNTLTLNP